MKEMNEIISEFIEYDAATAKIENSLNVTRTTVDMKSIEEISNTDKKQFGVCALFKYPSLRYNFLITSLIWFSYAFVYYGISFGLKNEEDYYVNGLLVYVAEISSYWITGLLINLTWWGRSKHIIIMLIFSGISLSLKYFIDFDPYIKIFTFSSRFGITAVTGMMYLYSTEVYPTAVRAMGVGLNVLSGRLGCSLVPILLELFNPLPMMIALCFISAFFSFFLPETLNIPLEEEIKEEKVLNEAQHNPKEQI